MKTFIACLLCGLLGLSTPAMAQPVAYDLNAQGSSIEFAYRLAGNPTRGRMGVADAALNLDFRNVERSSVQVTLDLSRATAGLIFATEAMRGAQVLDVRNHPKARFVSTSVQRAGQGARVTGNLTLRGVTKPVVLQARFFRAADADPANLKDLTLVLTGALDRRDFGATGFPDLVGPQIDLDIRARVTRR